MEQKYFINRRIKLAEKLNDLEMIILFSGKAPLKSADECYSYTPNRNFFYLTNVDEEEDIYVMYKENNEIHEMMFIHRYNELEAKWIGEKYSEEFVGNLSGIKEIYYLDEFASFIESTLKRFSTLYLDIERFV